MEILNRGAYPDLKYNCHACGTVFVASSAEYAIPAKTCSCPICGAECSGGAEYIRPQDDYMAEEAAEPWHILVTGSLTAGESATITDSRVNASMTISEYFVSDDDAIGTDWAVDTGDGEVTITGTISSACWIALHLVGDGARDEGEDGGDA